MPSSPPQDRPFPLSVLVLRVLFPFAAGYFLSYVFRSVNAVLSPDLVTELGLDATSLGLLTSVFFLSFALAQIPLGIALDRWGPRRVEAVLLLIAALGALLFALAQDIGGLLAGRALIGLGVSACLMAAFKAAVVWFPSQSLPMVNGVVLSAGGLGALIATAPVEAALGLTDWRGVFLILTAVTVGVAALLWTAVPEHAERGAKESFRQVLRGFGTICSDPTFRRIAPFTTLSQAAFLAIQSLWAGPWLRDVAAFTRPEAANVLLLIAVAMVAGFLSIGALAERLSRHGISPLQVGLYGMVAFLGIQVLLASGVASDSALAVTVLWMAFGCFGTSGIVVYAGLSQAFPKNLAGRVNTTLNMLVFSTAFAAQAGLGGLLDLWDPAPDGAYPAHAYGWAMGVAVFAQALALAWCMRGGTSRKVPGP